MMNDFKDIKIAVAGTGYVGLSIATLLTQHHHVTSVDVIPEKVEKLNNKISQTSKFQIGIVEHNV
ncbi:uDP-glucose 6-dehydrogenase [Prevotella sp. CAG:5226]|jgi:UDPglucose 6-dehydrogenase|nr:uDP-glucose 6-dehydrogenase [Prevotella sp. CAG:5226]